MMHSVSRGIAIMISLIFAAIATAITDLPIHTPSLQCRGTLYRADMLMLLFGTEVSAAAATTVETSFMSCISGQCVGIEGRSDCL